MISKQIVFIIIPYIEKQNKRPLLTNHWLIDYIWCDGGGAVKLYRNSEGNIFNLAVLAADVSKKIRKLEGATICMLPNLSVRT